MKVMAAGRGACAHLLAKVQQRLRDTQPIMAMIADKLQQVHARIAGACRSASRPVESVTLLVVSKTFGPDAVRAAVAAGEYRFG